MDIAYWAVVVLGAVTLVIEAYRQFSVSVDIHPHDRYPILKDVDLDALCTTGELIRGFLMYVSLYIGAYATILTSAEVFAAVADTAGEDAAAAASRIIGARDTSEDIKEIAEQATAFDLGKPIFVSATIIAALSIGIFAPVEKIMRSYAHWIAAIPRGVYRVISGLKRANFAQIGGGRLGPLAEMYRDGTDGIAEGAIDVEVLNDTIASLRAIDAIQPAVLGTMRDQIFTAYMHNTIDALLEKQEKEYTEFRDALKLIKDEPAKLEELQPRAAILRNNMEALFALLYIRNQKTVETSRIKGTVARIIEHLQKDREPAFHAVSGAVFFVALSILIIYPATYLLFFPKGAFANAEFFDTAKNFIRSETVVAIVLNLLIFSICSSIALLTREASREYGRWKDWSLNQVPYLRLFQHAIFPGIAAVIICAIAKLVEYLMAVQPEAHSFSVFVDTNWRFCAMNFVFGFAVALIVFFVVDQHDALRAPSTVMVALSACFPYVVWAIFVQSLDTNFTSLPNLQWMIREVFLLAFPAVVFALAFAILIELSEEGS